MSKSSIVKSAYGTTKSGEAVDAYLLTNASGASVKILTYGATLAELNVPDKNGKLGNVLLTFDDLAGYEGQTAYIGATIGRYGNRIANGKFTLEGKSYTLAQNNRQNSLHGGLVGYNAKVWSAEPVENPEGPTLALQLTDPDGFEGFPGTVQVTLVVTLTEENTLRLSYEATTDAPTPINLTQHAYFNLKDAGASPILDHVMRLNAATYTAVNEALIPTGELASVEGTAIDFRKSKPIGQDLQAMGGDPVGYDHNLVLDNLNGDLILAAKVTEPTTGRVLETWTTEPGVQFYSGNFLDGSIIGKGGVPFKQWSGFCLETQHYPDSVNQPTFPSTILRPGETYTQITEYRFSVV